MNTPYASDSAPQNYSYPKGIASVPFASFMRINKYSYDDGMAAVGKAQNDVLGSVQNSGLVKNVTEGLADLAQWLYGDKTGGNNYLAMEEKEMLAKFKENTENIHKPNNSGAINWEDNRTKDDLLNEQAKELTINETKRGKHLPLGLSELGNKAGLARLGLGTALFGFTPAIAWSTIYSARRYQRVRNVAKRRAGLIVGEGLQVEARKLLAEALENGDAGLRQQAETMLARADGMREAIDVITPEGVNIENIDDIVDNLERAHVLMDKAGMANMSVNGATLRNAYGDTADFREIISASVSSVKSTSELLQGVTKAQQRQILDYVDADWEPWSITDKSTTRAQYVKGWDGLLGRATQISDKHPNFYKIIWSEAAPKLKVEKLAE